MGLGYVSTSIHTTNYHPILLLPYYIPTTGVTLLPPRYCMGKGLLQGRGYIGKVLVGKVVYYRDGVHRVPAVAVIPWNVPGDIPYTNTWVP